MEYQYNDGRRPGGRKPRLYLAKGAQIAKFEGSNIAGFCAIAREKFTKNGNFSNTTFDLILAPGVRPLYFLSPLHGTWCDTLGSWAEVAQELGLPVEVAQQIIREEYPPTASRLDEVEKFVASLGQDAEVEKVVVTFGSPTRRQSREGYWSQPKFGKTTDGRRVVVQPGPKGWGEAVAVEPEGARVVGCRHSPAMHGGIWSIEIMIPMLSAPTDTDQK
jgi:hypothetical protein